MKTAPFILLPLVSVLGCAAPAQGSSVAPEPAPMPEQAPAEPVADAGPWHYRGVVELPGGQTLAFFVALDPAGRSSISIPAQGLFEGGLADVVHTNSDIEFVLSAVGARWVATRSKDAVTECSFSQRGAQLSCALEPIAPEAFAAAQLPPRPQTPVPPFPYDVEEVAYDNTADGVHLEGTLTIPPGDGPHPAALLITGSGAQDRDETILGHKPFAVLADHLSRKGIAVLRVDDRGVGGSTGSVQDSTGASLTRDAEAGVAFLRKHARIDGKRVGVIGHSEGGAIGPRVAAADDRLAFVVMMAGPGVPGHEIVRLQAVEVVRASGATQAQVEAVRQRQNATIDALMAASGVEDARKAVASVKGGDPGGAAMVNPWFLDFLHYDPAPTLRKVRCPVLVLNGELDMQVLSDQNVPAVEAALSHNKHVDILRLPGLNHLFQHAKTGSPSEYAQIEETMDPEVLEHISTWVAKH